MADAPRQPPEEQRDQPSASGTEGAGPYVRNAVVLSIVAALGLIAVNVWLHGARGRYRDEIERLRASMTAVERARADQVVESERDKVQLSLALLQRQSRLEGALHLSVSLDSGTMHLERDGAVLREMQVEVGPERRVGIPPDTVYMAAPRGVRSVARILGAEDTWDVPLWVYADRGMPADSVRVIAGALGSGALILDGGTVLYTQPTAGPLADSAYVLPGAVRLSADDMGAMLANIAEGIRVYFY